jgi:hypothetical protein
LCQVQTLVLILLLLVLTWPLVPTLRWQAWMI